MDFVWLNYPKIKLTTVLITSVVLIFVLALCAMNISSCANRQNLTNTASGAWVTYWDYSNGVNAVQSTPHVFNDVFLFVAHFNHENQVELHQSIDAQALHAFIEALNASGIRSWLTIVNDVVRPGGDVTLKDSSAVETLIDNTLSREAHITQLLRLVSQFGFSGIDIDYENLKYHLREKFNLFVSELTTRASESNVQVSFTVQPKDREKQTVGAGTMDWMTLCRNSDRLQIMLYNQHSGKTEPGPMATPAWITQILDYAISKCPRKKIVPVIKVSGMDWSEGKAQGIQFVDVQKLIQEYQVDVHIDSRGDTPYFFYSEADVAHTVYFENARSLLAKLEGIFEYNVAAVVFWSIGKQDPALLKVLAGESPQE